MEIEGIDRKTLNQIVYENLREAILKGSISEGERLRETIVAKSLNVSATPVREAFRMLATEGLVKIEPWKGVVVQGFSQNEKKDTMECRKALELLALELFFEEMTQEDIEAIKESIQKSKIAEEKEFSRISNSIHNVWILGSRNIKIATLLQFLGDVTSYEMTKSSRDRERKEDICKEHLDIYYGLLEKDLEKAKKALAFHIEKGYYYNITKDLTE